MEIDLVAKNNHTYYIKTKIFSWHTYLIENENKEKVFYLDGFHFCDALGDVIYTIDEKFFTFKKTIYIKQKDGNLIATIKKAGFFSWSDWKIEILRGYNMEVSEAIIASYTINSNGKEIAKIWNTGFFRESYEVKIEPGQNDALILAITAVLSPIYSEDRKNDLNRD
jgi:uncharacterized protein YxjI